MQVEPQDKQSLTCRQHSWALEFVLSSSSEPAHVTDDIPIVDITLEAWRLRLDSRGPPRKGRQTQNRANTEVRVALESSKPVLILYTCIQLHVRLAIGPPASSQLRGSTRRPSTRSKPLNIDLSKSEISTASVGGSQTAGPAALQPCRPVGHSVRTFEVDRWEWNRRQRRGAVSLRAQVLTWPLGK